ncbi:MAG: universal stress protein [Lutibacter sp.]|uniref:universal stress protein n=1 Tax=Lutibacter sp. TaxID=1925666 RepID=UPI00299E4862|nr:universal stress protein [Lutibacter sp.]MDX1828250.1 universal stress protein [Lutibacter sp.]
MISKILVAIDGSESALNAANCALKLAKQINASIEIVYVVRYSIGNIAAGIMPFEIEENEKEKAIKLINKIKSNNPEIKITDFETIGLPILKIIKMTEDWDAELLIIGHHTHNFIEKLFLSSVENSLLNNLKIPMMIIPKRYNCN